MFAGNPSRRVGVETPSVLKIPLTCPHIDPNNAITLGHVFSGNTTAVGTGLVPPRLG